LRGRNRSPLGPGKLLIHIADLGCGGVIADEPIGMKRL
jgi:hypothetical protein